jgi:hypothetical protein
MYQDSKGNNHEEWVIDEERWEQLERERGFKPVRVSKSGKVGKPNKVVLQLALTEIETGFPQPSLPIAELTKWLRSLMA